jgi:hypothetical protein
MSASHIPVYGFFEKGKTADVDFAASSFGKKRYVGRSEWKMFLYT